MAEQQISRFDSRRLIDNREMRIFLSSTFSDMQQEREALIKTFQSLKIEAIRRNVTLSVLDLRWGVTDDEARSGKVLSVCLEEIEHSHPFFIGLLGSCYGSSPDISGTKVTCCSRSFDSCVSTSKVRMESISSPKRSIR